MTGSLPALANSVSRIDDLTGSQMTGTLSKEAVDRLSAGLASCRSKQGLTLEAREAIRTVCAEARLNGFTPEQLLIAVKDACHASPEIASMTTTSERDTFLAKVITACIKEYYRAERGD